MRAYSKYIPRLDGREPLAMRPDFAFHIRAGHVDVLETDRVIGYVIVFEDDGEMMLDNIAIDPSESGKGYASILVRFVEDRFRKQGLKTYKLYTNEVMTENLAWYPRIGFEEYSRCTIKGMNRVNLRKILG